MQKGPTTPKGFRDIEASLAKKRRTTINTIIDSLEESGFGPLETPIIEFASTLLGKYGAEEKLIYTFVDRGGRELALRYDLTVPLARYVANTNPKLPFKRYQVGEVFRGENTQKGRYRQFTQLDFDIVGDSSASSDATTIASAIKAARLAGKDKCALAVNDRAFFEGMPISAIRAVDKYYKIGEKGVKVEMEEEGLKKDEVTEIWDKLQSPPTKRFSEVKLILEKEHGLKDGVDFFFDRYLARGLDYYTGLVFELKETPNPEGLSLGGGGRYDNLIGMFAGRKLPAVGFSFGLDRFTEI